MKTGDTVRDPNGQSYEIGALMGRGLWGRSYAARDVEHTDSELVLKVPLDAADLGGDRKLAQACVEISLELGRLHAELGGHGTEGKGLHPLSARFRDIEDRPVLVFPRATTTLEERLVQGASLEETLATTSSLTRLLQELAPSTPFHGVLKPSNVLLDGQGGLTLTDVLVPAFQAALPALLAHHPASRPYIAPELRERGGGIPGVSTDTYALCMAIYRGIVQRPEVSGPESLLPLEGLDKARLVAMKDRAHNRLQDEHANPRFHTRLTDRVAALLNRALSRETSPSPPYRFSRHEEFRTRLTEVQALVHPAVTHVGRLLLDRPPGRAEFSTDDEVALSCSVACTQGVESHEEIACGLAIFDDDKGQRVRDIPCAYTVSRHPSGRFRFGFRLQDLHPGAYRLRIAFTIRDSGLEPATAEGRFVVRAAAGYVPPRELPEAQAIPMRRDEPATTVTEPGVQARPPAVARLATGTGHRHGSPSQEMSTPAPRTILGQAPGAAAAAVLSSPTPGPQVPLAQVHSFMPQQDEAPTQVAVTEQRHFLPPLAPRTAPPPQVAAPHVPSETPRPMGVAGISIPGRHDLPSEPRVGFGPTVTVTEDPEDTAEDEPDYQGLGRWTDLPLPRTSGEELPSPSMSARREHTDDFDIDGHEESPLTTAIADIFELVRGDAFVLFIGGAAVLIILLVVALILLS